MSFIVQLIRLGCSPPLTQQMHSFHKYHWWGIKKQKEKREHLIRKRISRFLSTRLFLILHLQRAPVADLSHNITVDGRESGKKLTPVLSIFNALGHLLRRLLVIMTERGGNCWFIDGMFSSCCRFNLKKHYCAKDKFFFFVSVTFWMPHWPFLPLHVAMPT